MDPIAWLMSGEAAIDGEIDAGDILGGVAEEEDGAGGGKGDRGRERKRGKEENDEKEKKQGREGGWL